LFIKVETDGVSIPGELYRLSSDQYEHLVSTEPPHMYPAEITLDGDGTAIAMLYPEELIRQNTWPAISDAGGWICFKKSGS